jgi:hypothetical protein
LVFTVAATGGWQEFNSLENIDYHTRPWLEITTDCPGCIGGTTDFNVENTHEGIDGGTGTPLMPGGSASIARL